VTGGYPISSYLQISPAGTSPATDPSGTNFAAHYGVNIGGAYTVDTADFNAATHALNGYVDNGVHTGNGAIFMGTYSTTMLDLTGTSPTGIAITGATAVSVYMTVNPDFHYAGTSTCANTGSFAVLVNGAAHAINYC
jgi:hypothetical protein